MTQHEVLVASQFLFDTEVLSGIAQEFRDTYLSASPFPHVVLDDFLPLSVVDDLLAEFPGPQDDVHWQVLEHGRERKLALAADWRMGLLTRQILALFNSSTFVTFLEHLTGIEGLIPDPHFEGGGLHQIELGGFLKVHADFNKHERLQLDRRLNVLLYLNRDWRDDYGGQLQLWDRDMTHCVESVLPVAGRCVIFSTTDFSYHGHPDPLTCPIGMTRKSLALYYYSNGRPAEEVSGTHSTLFRDRPGRLTDSVPLPTQAVLRRLVPPIILDSTRTLRHRLSKGRDQSGER